MELWKYQSNESGFWKLFILCIKQIRGLIFEEIKIKEGLIWSQHTNKLLGFKDIECMQDRGDEECLARHILQFFFKSLFAEITCPCVY